MNTREKLKTMPDEKILGLLEKLKSHLTPQRWEKIESRSVLRTRHIAVVLENIHYTQNMSAVIRTCDCLGVQDLYIVGQVNNPRINRGVALGASNWVDVHRDTRRTSRQALQAVKDRGYRLVATLPREDAVDLADLDLREGPVAVMFGQELCGLSPEAVEMADIAVKIPMFGFSDSFNVSVSAGICLYELRKKLLAAEDGAWGLSDRELLELQYLWAKRSLAHGDMIEAEYEFQLEHPNAQ